MSDIAEIGTILADARAGRPFVILDDLSPDSNGHLVLPAELTTPDIVNIMAKHARGLVCLAMDRLQAERLGLRKMPRNETSRRDVFTVSIEAREGVTTGISAFDRARTIAVAVDPASTARDLVSPGHVFPIVVRDGGVLVAPGRAEAATDIARLAGFSGAATMCEVLDEAGEIGRLADLRSFGAEHGVHLVTVADLVAFRRRSEKLVERVASAPFSSRYCGDATIHVYHDTIEKGEHVALVRGRVQARSPTLVRVHQVDIATDLLGWSAARQDYVSKALLAMRDHDGPSVAVFVHDPDPSSLADRINGKRHEYMMTQAVRDYGLGAQILLDLGVGDMILLTSSQRKLAALEGFGLRIVRHQDISGEGA